MSNVSALLFGHHQVETHVHNLKSATFFSDYVSVILSDDGRIERPKRVVEKYKMKVQCSASCVCVWIIHIGQLSLRNDAT